MAGITEVETRSREKASSAAPPREVAMDYLRGFVVVLVVIHHSVLAYMGGLPLEMHQFAGGAMLWRAFPVIDSQRWAPAGLITGFNDVFFMSLMFFLSGLFVLEGLRRKGAWMFLRARILRLAIPFFFLAGVVAPLAYYAAYLERGNTPGFLAYAHSWNAIGYWPTGPAWFVLLLLIFDVGAALFYAIAPRWGEVVGELARGAQAKPARFFWRVVFLTLLAYAPLAYFFGASSWTYLGLLQFQSSRLLHYFVWFLLGAGVGACGIRSGLLAPNGRLARRWLVWTGAMIGAFVLGALVFLVIIASKGAAREVWTNVGSFTFVLSCTASCFGFLALFARFAQRPNGILNSLARNSYGIYLVHYAFVAWAQFTLLTAPMTGAEKALCVIASALALSWFTISLLRRIPLVARII